MTNVLFIMCDQLRADYLSCNGHPYLHTPHIDRLAEMGVNFSRAYVQAPICGPSRACFYTGRYASTHGATLNYAPLALSEKFLGDYLTPLGVRTALCGKSHIVPNRAELDRLNIRPEHPLYTRLAEGGFEPFFRDDGVHPDPNPDKFADYNHFLREQGYTGHNPWHQFTHGVDSKERGFQSGWFLENANLPADIPEALSETPVTTTKAIEFIDEATANGEPWCLHLSYIKPHWPFMAPAPYTDLYSEKHLLPPNRTESEREAGHPVIDAFMQHQDSRVYQHPGGRERVIPTYMGLIKQIDDQIGRLLAHLEEKNLLKTTLIIFTSDHGDYLGDHWLGEKDLFHEESVRVPMIVVDPSPLADKTRGSLDNRLVEALDVVPTLIDFLGGEIPAERLEGRSLLPLLRAQPIPWRNFVVSEIDYAFRKAREWLNLEPAKCKATMIYDGRWKYILYEGFRPQLFDLESDPKEQHDLGSLPEFGSERDRLNNQLFTWFRHRKRRTTLSDESIKEMFGGWNQARRGVYVGYWSPDDLPIKVKGRDRQTEQEDGAC
ncbi:MAG: sulfatase-like hydrolase/transferase [Chloroflexota bacterium]